MNSPTSAEPADDAVDLDLHARPSVRHRGRTGRQSGGVPDRYRRRPTRDRCGHRTRCSRPRTDRPARTRRCRSSRCRWRRSRRHRPRARVTRAVRSNVRPPIAAAACDGSGDIGGRYTYRRVVGCGEWSRNRAPNSSIIRSSSGSTPWRSASLHHSSIIPASRSGSSAGEVVALRTVDREVVQLPRLRCRSRRPAGACTPPSSRRRRSPDCRPSRSTARCCATAQLRRRQDVGERMPGHRDLVDAPVRRRRFDTDDLVDRRHDVGHVDELVASRPAASATRRRPASARSSARGRRPRGCSACTTGTACCRTAPSPTDSWCGCAGRRCRRCARTASSGISRMPLKNFISCITPNGPPSWDAPLSVSSTTIVLSSSPSSARPSMNRPIWSSV